MDGNGSGMRMVVNLEILEARNVIVKPVCIGGKDSLFVRYYLSTGTGKGDNNMAVNTRDVMVAPDPQWKQIFCLECGVSIEDCNFISLLQKQSLRFELRERNSRTKVLGSRFRTSKLVGWVEIPWKNLLASPTLTINSWFPLIGANIGGGSQTQPSLHLAISICKMHLSVCALQFLVESVSQTPLENRTVKEIYDPEDMSCVNEFRGNFVNMSRRIKRLDMEARQCRGNYSEVQYEDDSCFYSTVESTAPF